MRLFARVQAYFLWPYANAPTAVQVKSRMLLWVSAVLMAIQVATAVVIQLAIRHEPSAAFGIVLVLAAYGLVLALLRRGRFRLASVLSMLLLYGMLTSVGLTATASDPVLSAGRLAALLCAFVIYTSLVGERIAEPIVATVLSIATVAAAYLLRSDVAAQYSEPYETGWVINFCWILGFVGTLSTLTSLIYRRSMKLAEDKTREALEGAEQVRVLQERLLRAEKLEAIGQLAGGVAHDFNNELVCVLGYAELLEQSQSDPTAQSHAQSIVEAAQRSARLAQQLLAFARREPLELIATDLHDVIGRVAGALDHGQGARVTVVRELGAPRGFVLGDASRLHHALLNLALNARDAMPDGGTLTFRTRQRTIEPGAADAEGSLCPGAYLEVEVSDTGVGMDAETRAHLFEPFFTTKGPGKGTGLGLAAVRGTILSHGGSIQCHSEPGRGAVFRVLLPLADGASSPPRGPVETEPASSVRRRILLVDDEPAVRRLGATMLTKLGHEVVEASNGEEAIARFRDAEASFDLVLLDAIMPDRNGREVFHALSALQPDVRVVMVSGYSVEGAIERVLEAGGRGFLQKPYTLAELRSAIERAVAD
jgi:signal transduction histidine kinase/ActR/RegA family two-component response regulator